MPFKIRSATVSDIPALIDLYFTAFKNPFALTVFRDTPPIRKWWTDMLLDEIQNQPEAIFLKVIECSDEGDAKENPETIIAFAKWISPKEGMDPEEEMKVPELPDDVDKDLFKNYFGQLGAQHKKLLGETQHWYLELLATDPNHQRRGAATLLMSHILNNPANTGVPAYLEASPEGVSTYRRFGFEKQESVVVDIRGHGDYETLLMVRPPGDNKA